MIAAFLVGVGLAVAMYLSNKYIRDSRAINYCLAVLVIIAVVIFIYNYTYLDQGLKDRL